MALKKSQLYIAGQVIESVRRVSSGRDAVLRRAGADKEARGKARELAFELAAVLEE